MSKYGVLVDVLRKVAIYGTHCRKTSATHKRRKHFFPLLLVDPAMTYVRQGRTNQSTYRHAPVGARKTRDRNRGAVLPFRPALGACAWAEFRVRSREPAGISIQSWHDKGSQQRPPQPLGRRDGAPRESRTQVAASVPREHLGSQATGSMRETARGYTVASCQ